MQWRKYGCACPFAIQVWNTTGLWGSIQHALSTTASGIEAIFSLLQNLSVELSQRFTTAIWSIWKHRNLRVWDDHYYKMWKKRRPFNGGFNTKAL